MITIQQFREFALQFPEVTEQPHFENTSFRVKNKIFASYDDTKKRACLKLSEIDQSVFSSAAKSVIYPVDNKWGKQGWTFVELSSVHPDLLIDALTTAYCCVAPKKLAEKVRKQDID